MTEPTLPDPRLIELHDAQETPYWCKHLCVTEAQLISAVQAVGHRADDVKNYLRRQVERQEREQEDTASG